MHIIHRAIKHFEDPYDKREHEISKIFLKQITTNNYKRYYQMFELDFL